MKRLLLLLLILPLVGCFGKAIRSAHKTEGEYLQEYAFTADTIFVGVVKNWQAERKAHLDTINAYTIEKEKDANGNIPVTRLHELRLFRKDLEAKDDIKFAEVEAKWVKNGAWFEQAMKIREAITKWINAIGFL